MRRLNDGQTDDDYDAQRAALGAPRRDNLLRFRLVNCITSTWGGYYATLLRGGARGSLGARKIRINR